MTVIKILGTLAVLLFVTFIGGAVALSIAANDFAQHHAVVVYTK